MVVKFSLDVLPTGRIAVRFRLEVRAAWLAFFRLCDLGSDASSDDSN